MKKLEVKLKNLKYKINISRNIFHKIVINHSIKFKMSNAFIITDANVSQLYLKKFESCLSKKKIIFNSFVIQPGEKSKSFGILSSTSNKILSKNVKREDIIYALGGGIVGDLAGFIAAILLRGIRFIQVPTTLLAQVDSSDGGKTGINTFHGKNLIGAFHQPAAVVIDPTILKSLPSKDYLAGYAEVVKYALINDKRFFDWLEKNRKKILKLDYKTVEKIVYTCCSKKAEIVGQDEKESGKRMYLNLGHTFAHAIESELDYKVMHGEAVSLGLLMAMKLSFYLGKIEMSKYVLVENHLRRINLPTTLIEINKKKKWSANKILNKMKSDKKVADNFIRFILCKDIGEVFIKSNISRDKILMTIKDFI